MHFSVKIMQLGLMVKKIGAIYSFVQASVFVICIQVGATTLIITTFSMTTLGIMTVRIMTISI